MLTKKDIEKLRTESQNYSKALKDEQVKLAREYLNILEPRFEMKTTLGSLMGLATIALVSEFFT